MIDVGPEQTDKRVPANMALFFLDIAFSQIGISGRTFHTRVQVGSLQELLGNGLFFDCIQVAVIFRLFRTFAGIPRDRRSRNSLLSVRLETVLELFGKCSL